MFNRLVQHLVKHNLFDDEQHGFRKGRSTTTALIKFVEFIIDAIDEKNKVIAVLMDLQKVFDILSPEILLDKLEKLGLKGNILKLFESFLTDRRQYVEISKVVNNHLTKFPSATQKVKYGVPQGSILGPLLFICYILGMPQILKSGIRNIIKHLLCIFADDVNLILSALTEEELEIYAFTELSKLIDYFIENQLILNTSKTNFMSFRTKQNRETSNLSIFIDNESIPQTENTKLLGLHIDCNLSWDTHVDNVISKANSGIFVIKQMSYLCNLPALKTIYHAHVQSHIAYGICVYGGTSDQNLKKVLLVQKRAIRTMLKLKYHDTVKHLFTELKILTVYSLYILECIMYVRNNHLDNIVNNHDHPYFTRNKKDIKLPRHNLNLYEKKTSYAGSRFFKHLPKLIKNVVNANTFRTRLKEFLLENAFYSLKEFFELSV